jgi:hypothetical protein
MLPARNDAAMMMLPRKGAFSTAVVPGVSNEPPKVVSNYFLLHSKEEIKMRAEKVKERANASRQSAIRKREIADIKKAEVSAFGSTYPHHPSPSKESAKMNENKSKNHLHVKPEWEYERTEVPEEFKKDLFEVRTIARMRAAHIEKVNIPPPPQIDRTKSIKNNPIEQDPRLKKSVQKFTQRTRKAYMLKQYEQRQRIEEEEDKARSHLPEFLQTNRDKFMDAEKKALDKYNKLYRSRREERLELERKFKEKMAILKELQRMDAELDAEEIRRDNEAMDVSGNVRKSGTGSLSQQREHTMASTSDTHVPFSDASDSAKAPFTSTDDQENKNSSPTLYHDIDDSDITEYFALPYSYKGVLEILQDDERWTSYIFYISKDTLFYQVSKADFIPAGTILLEGSSLEKVNKAIEGKYSCFTLYAQADGLWKTFTFSVPDGKRKEWMKNLSIAATLPRERGRSGEAFFI